MEKYNTIGEYPRIRWKTVKYEDPIDGGEYTDYYFVIFRRPFFFGLMGKRKWEFAVQTNCFESGISFCKYLLGDKSQSFNK